MNYFLFSFFVTSIVCLQHKNPTKNASCACSSAIHSLPCAFIVKCCTLSICKQLLFHFKSHIQRNERLNNFKIAFKKPVRIIKIDKDSYWFHSVLAQEYGGQNTLRLSYLLKSKASSLAEEQGKKPCLCSGLWIEAWKGHVPYSHNNREAVWTPANHLQLV